MLMQRRAAAKVDDGVDDSVGACDNVSAGRVRRRVESYQRARPGGRSLQLDQETSINSTGQHLVSRALQSGDFPQAVTSNEQRCM